MARVQYGAIVTELKGKIAGQVFQKGNNSLVLRNKGYAAGTSSAARSAANRNITTQASRWKSLTSMQVAAWEAVVLSWPFIDKFGNSYIGTAYQVFIAYNSALMQLGLSVVDTPGTPGVDQSPGIITASYDLSGALTIGWPNVSILPQYLQFFVSPAMSAGRNNNNVRFKYINVTDQSLSDEWSDSPTYSTYYGIPPVGSKIVVKITCRNPVFPKVFETQIISLIVTNV